MDQADFPGDTIGYINFAPFLIGTPVINTYYLKLAVSSIHNADHGAKRQVGVCRREGFGVEALAIAVLRPLNPGPYQLELTHPSLDRLHGLIQMRNERCFHAPEQPGT